MTTMLPLYAYITHIVSLIMLIAMGTKSHKTRDLVFVISALITAYFVSLLALSDYEIYKYWFESIDINNPDEGVRYVLITGEYLFYYINYIFKLFTDDFSFAHFSIVAGALIIKLFFLLRWGRAYSISFIFYIAILFYPDSYLLRSTLASSIILIGVWGIMNNKPVYYFLISIFIASMVHTSALIALPIWFFRKIDIRIEYAYMLLGIIFIMSFMNVGHGIVSLFTSYFLDGTYISEILIEYTDSKYSNSIGILRLSLLVYVLIVIVFIAYKKYIIKHTDHYNLILSIVLYSLFLLVSLSDFEVLADRLFRLLSFFLVIAFGYIIASVSRDIRSLAIAIMVIILNFIPYLTSLESFTFIN
jgi:hypothetical protein